MKKEDKKKKWNVVFSDEILNKLDDIPDEVSERFEKLIKKFKTGELDPTKIGQPIDWVELKIKLKYPECESEHVGWLLDKNSNEVTFHCLKCNESFWMTIKEYKNAVRKNPDSIINSKTKI